MTWHPAAMPLRVRTSTRARAAATAAVALAACAGLAGGCYSDGTPRDGVCTFDGAEAVPDEGWTHVNTEEELVYEHNPPASGPHFPVWASWGVHDDVVNRGNWVHNLEHGGIVLLIGPDATDAERQQVLDGFDAISDDPECGHPRTVVTDDPKLDVHTAAVAADIVLEASPLTPDAIAGFADACRNRAREDICY